METGALVVQLSMETGMYIELQSVLEEEQKAVIKRDYQGLYGLVSKKESILAGLSASAAARGLIIKDLLKGAGPVKGPGLEALMGEMRPGEELEALQGAREKLAAVRERVMGLNHKNGRLIASSLAGLGRALDFLESFFMADTYLSTGLHGGKSRKGTRLREGV